MTEEQNLKDNLVVVDDGTIDTVINILGHEYRIEGSSYRDEHGMLNLEALWEGEKTFIIEEMCEVH